MRHPKANNIKHGLYGTASYNIWRNIRRRCLQPNDAKYPDYGGRGITICARWNDFAAFNADMGPRPSRLHSIDRRDNDLGYTPENCYWATWHEQQSNRRDTRKITHNGRTQCLMHWARELGISNTTLARRLERGMPLDMALSNESYLPSKTLTLNGRTQSVPEWSAELGVKQNTLWGRIVNGWSDEEVLTRPVVRRPRPLRPGSRNSIRLQRRASAEGLTP
jgi:hypothetical protein